MLQEITIDNNLVKVILSGSIYVEDAQTIRGRLLDYVDRGHCHFVVDLSIVEYIDISGLAALVAVRNNALRQGGDVKITGLRGLVKELFELTRLTRVFEVVGG